MGHYKRTWGLKCRLCGRPVKELAGCELMFESKTVPLNICLKCLKRLGLKKDEVQGEIETNSV